MSERFVIDRSKELERGDCPTCYGTGGYRGTITVTCKVCGRSRGIAAELVTAELLDLGCGHTRRERLVAWLRGRHA